MSLVIRLAVAILAGGLLAVALAYLGLVITMLMMIGSSLGAESREPMPAHFVTLLVIAAAGAAAGGWLTARLARSDASLALLGLALSLAAVYWGWFTGRPSGWPDWWPPTLALAAVSGVWLTAATMRTSE